MHTEPKTLPNCDSRGILDISENDFPTFRESSADRAVQENTEFERIRSRARPEIRTVIDAMRDRRTGVSTGCETCRLTALRLVDKTPQAASNYFRIVRRCSHIQVGVFKGSSK